MKIRMKRKLCPFVLVFAMIASLCQAASGEMSVKAQSREKAQTKAGTVIPWDGTMKEEPEQAEGVYQIGTAAELAWFAEYVNTLGAADTGLVKVDAVLTEDIDLGGYSWTPISKVTYVTDAYAGHFDGQNHTVSGLKIDTTDANYGLFSVVNTATIENLKVEGDVSSKGVGGIIAKLQAGGTVRNCSMRGSVRTTGSGTSSGYAAGIIGVVTNAPNAIISGCCNEADINGSHAGGIIGYNSNAALISSCYNTGTITGTTRSGGIAGQQQKGTIGYCYSIGTSKNGICGFSNAAITNCYYLAEKTSDASSTPGGTPTGTGYETITDKKSLLQNLNAAGSEGIYCEDIAGINEGYPVFGWQLDSDVAKVPVTEVSIIGEKKTGALLMAQALGEEGETATNVTYQWEQSADGKIFTDIPNASGRSFEIPDEVGYAGKYIRVRVSGEEDSLVISKSFGPIEKSDTILQAESREKIKQVKDTLSLSKMIIREAGTLTLPAEENGCIIKWTSSREDIISHTGIIALPEEGIVSVTLTAEITCGSEKDSKTFSVEVWAANVDAEIYLQKALDAIQWDFKLLQPVYGEDTNILVKLKALLTKKGYEGISVAVHSTEDEELISKNGRIHYPEIPEEGSFANGKQVKVFFDLTVEEQTVTYPTTNTYAFLVPWEKGGVEESLRQAADEALTEEVLRGDNEGLSAVVSDLNLPSCIEGDKYSFAQIIWRSSDESHLAVSDENRMGSADAYYNPYVGKVYPDSVQHEVTLTAEIKNPSTDVMVSKSFEITILPMSGEQLGQTLNKMQQILACYTADKLTDYTTKEKLDTSAVKHDIGLVIPKNVVTKAELSAMDYGQYWDYWNYKFTVTSSNTKVIDVNSFRAYVYRPLGTDSSADKKVTLHVQMTSKENPNLSVSKEIEVVVAHLGREEINQALALMDAAKTGYEEGLLGGNTDAYSIIDNLTPYREIIWNKDRTGVEYIYRYADMKNNGIVVDELPEWEDQEDWRLFRTSDRDQIANETLILGETPEEDTFVKINSVLTDEVFGKYYTKFRDDKSYDAETLAKFKQLYKQPVHTYVMVVGKGNYTVSFSSMTKQYKSAVYHSKLAAFQQELDRPISVSFSVIGKDGEIIVPKTTETSFTKGATVFDVFKKVLGENGIAYTAKGSYISSINGLAEFTDGDNSGWMYTVGDVYVNSYMNAQELVGGEEIVVKYVEDYKLANMQWTEQETPTPSGTQEPQESQEPTETQKPIASPEVSGMPSATPEPTVSPDVSPEPVQTVQPSHIPQESGQPSAQPTNVPGTPPAGMGEPGSGSVSQTPNEGENRKESHSEGGKKSKKKKTIKRLKLSKYKEGTKKIEGRTLKKAKVVVKIGKYRYQVTATRKGRFQINLKKKLKSGTRICVMVSKPGYKKKQKQYRVK